MKRPEDLTPEERAEYEAWVADPANPYRVFNRTDKKRMPTEKDIEMVYRHGIIYAPYPPKFRLPDPNLRVDEFKNRRGIAVRYRKDPK